MPHPYGVDVELLQRLIQITTFTNMKDFLKGHFHRVGEITAQKFLDFSKLMPAKAKTPKKLSHEEIVRLMQNLKKYKDFLPPDASCLSPFGEDLLRAGVHKELNPSTLWFINVNHPLMQVTHSSLNWQWLMAAEFPNAAPLSFTVLPTKSPYSTMKQATFPTVLSQP